MNKTYSRGSVLTVVVIGLAVAAIFLTSILSHVTAMALSYKESSGALTESLLLGDIRERLLSADSADDIAYVTGKTYAERGVKVTLSQEELLLSREATNGCVFVTVEFSDGRNLDFYIEIVSGARAWQNAEVGK